MEFVTAEFEVFERVSSKGRLAYGRQEANEASGWYVDVPKLSGCSWQGRAKNCCPLYWHVQVAYSQLHCQQTNLSDLYEWSEETWIRYPPVLVSKIDGFGDGTGGTHCGTCCHQR
jgi:hypothetical protein